MCDACGIQLQLENISRVQTRLGSKTETDFHRSSWRTIEILHGLGIGSWSPSWASGFTTYTPSQTSRRKIEGIGCGGWEISSALAGGVALGHQEVAVRGAECRPPKTGNGSESRIWRIRSGVHMLMKEDATFEYRCSPVVVYWRLGTSCLSSYLGDMLWPPDDGSDHKSGPFSTISY